jgi:hypothetical protein
LTAARRGAGLGTGVPVETIENALRYPAVVRQQEKRMKKTLAILATVAAVGVTAFAAPAEARGIGPGLAFGLAAGAVAAGAYGAFGPYYGPYGYYGTPYYGPAYYGPGPYAYYGGPYPRYHRYYRHHR